MKTNIAALFLLVVCILVSCSKAIYSTNGENIYREGKNLAGETLLDKKNSKITIFKSCQSCHGPSGTRIKSCNIQWTYLSDPTKITVPYTRELFYRFVDEDRKSDGSKARTGVHWKMSMQEKDDLIEYLKTIK